MDWVGGVRGKSVNSPWDGLILDGVISDDQFSFRLDHFKLTPPPALVRNRVSILG